MRLLWHLAVVALLGAHPAFAGSRLKDVAMIAGARDNQLSGLGLVVGIAGDGDKNPIYTVQSVANLLKRYGITVPAQALVSKNVAVVMVTAEVAAFKKPGSRLDVTVSSMGDAKTLQGGVLLQTPLIGADGEVYVVAQGAISIGGISAGNESASVQKNHPTVGQIANGGIVEKEIPAEVVQNNTVEVLLREPDFTSAARVADAVNGKFTNSAVAVDSTTVRVRVPEKFSGSEVSFLARLEAVEVDSDIPARIIINERTGTIVATSRVRISACAVSQGNITITIANTSDVSQPNALSQGGQTAVTPRTDANLKEDKGALVPLPDMPTVEKVAQSLNALGVTPRDMMSIFMAMKQAGALQADLVLR